MNKPQRVILHPFNNRDSLPSFYADLQIISDAKSMPDVAVVQDAAHQIVALYHFGTNLVYNPLTLKEIAQQPMSLT